MAINKKLATIFLAVFTAFLDAGNKKSYKTPRPSAITYTLSGGRLGDNIISMLHAAWIAYTHKIDLVVHSFPQTDQFAFSYQYPHLSSPLVDTFETVRRFSFVDRVTPETALQKSSVLYVVPYFPEFPSEWNNHPFAGPNNGPCCTINWSDCAFIEYARNLLRPITPLKFDPLPSDLFSVAVHFRCGTGFDPANINQVFPYKFPPIDFYEAALRILSQRISGKKIFAYVFTDDPSPKGLVDELKARLPDISIEFACRETNNSHNKNVIEDFFDMQRYPCIIHPHSNYSYLAAKLGDSVLAIEPHEISIKAGRLIVHTVALSEKKAESLVKTIIPIEL